MSFQETCFTPFIKEINSYLLPEKFTFPFYYDPHPLCVLAAEELQAYLKTQEDWVHNFGLSDDEVMPIGKMFGVLLVQNKHNKVGYLAGFSGKLAGKNHLTRFVPPVSDLLAEDGFFLQSQSKINQINEQIDLLEENPKIQELNEILSSEITASSLQVQQQRQAMIEKRKLRKSKRQLAEIQMNANGFILLKEQLAKESVEDKNQLKRINAYWQEKIQISENELKKLMLEIASLKEQRKSLSASLQKKIFDQYRFLNSKGKSKSLKAIFQVTPQKIPPAGAEECATPKLLQYAFKCGFKPLAMAEFWWGASPKSAIRKHKYFYPACRGKCQPILGHMLEGMTLDDNPLLNNPAEGKSIDIIHEEDTFLIINKPEGLLSVPGKDIEDSVYSRIKASYPNAEGSLIVHRLDMLTSGLMVIALTKEAHKKLQKQFIKRSVKKHYIALLDGILNDSSGVIELPLRVDLDDRPRQLVCYEHGKSAKTLWEVIERQDGKTKVRFSPVTGRSHQLRVHSAHIDGLNTPILGDDLYGNTFKDKNIRLHLHAEFLELQHPISNNVLSFKVEAEF